ncbi:MAG TPA: DUF308 domain-containing protein [Gammaproteobacteria bacterium]|nr:DUF308 domain-containing protein [Gammaproteobacteria bacterium]
MDHGHGLAAALSARWWVLVLRGSFAVLAGSAMLLWPDIPLTVAQLFIGTWLLVDGALSVAAGVPGRRKPLQLIDAGLCVAAGLIILPYPQLGAFVLLATLCACALGRALLSFSVAAELGAAQRTRLLLGVTGLHTLVFAGIFFAGSLGALSTTIPVIAWYVLALGALQAGLGFWLERVNGFEEAPRHHIDSP